MTKHALMVYLFGDVYALHKEKVISNRFIINTIRELKESGEAFEPIRRRDFEIVKQKLGEGGQVLIMFPDDLHVWYADIYENTKRGLWVKLHKKLLDKLSKICYNISHEKIKEV
jgi:hypothetical protein